MHIVMCRLEEMYVNLFDSHREELASHLHENRFCHIVRYLLLCIAADHRRYRKAVESRMWELALDVVLIGLDVVA